MVPDSGHYPQAQQPATVFAAIVRFLARSVAPAANLPAATRTEMTDLRLDRLGDCGYPRWFVPPSAAHTQ